MPDVVGTEGKDEDEERVERYHPEHVLKEDQRTIQTWRKRRVCDLELKHEIGLYCAYEIFHFICN